jgi:hypothetical protein
MRVCASCGAPRYGWRSAFCTRCGSSSFRGLKSYNADVPRTGWKSLPIIVRLAIYIVCIPPIIGATVWAIVILFALTAGSR